MTMTEIEAKALALVNAHAINRRSDLDDAKHTELRCALLDAVQAQAATEARHAAELREQAERFSEVLAAIRRKTVPLYYHDAFDELAAPFILPAPDPLVEVFDDCFHQNVEEGETWSQAMARKTRAAIEARGGKIVWEAGE